METAAKVCGMQQCRNAQKEPDSGMRRYVQQAVKNKKVALIDLLIFSGLLWEDIHGKNKDQLNNVAQSEEGESYG